MEKKCECRYDKVKKITKIIVQPYLKSIVSACEEPFETIKTMKRHICNILYLYPTRPNSVSLSLILYIKKEVHDGIDLKTQGLLSLPNNTCPLLLGNITQ